MANIGSSNVKMEGLWSEAAFQNMFVKPWAEICKNLQDAGDAGVLEYISTRRVACVLREYAHAENAAKCFNAEYLYGATQMQDNLIPCMLKSRDEATTLRKYTIDELLSTALAALFPKKEVRCDWFIDGLNEYGSFIWKGLNLVHEEKGYV